MPRSFIELSLASWSLPDDIKPTPEQIQVGCLQRIAASCEKMEQPYLDLHRDLNYYKAMASGRDETIKELRLSNASLKGHITRLRKRINQLENKGEE